MDVDDEENVSSSQQHETSQQVESEPESELGE